MQNKAWEASQRVCADRHKAIFCLPMSEFVFLEIELSVDFEPVESIENCVWVVELFITLVYSSRSIANKKTIAQHTDNIRQY